MPKFGTKRRKNMIIFIDEDTIDIEELSTEEETEDESKGV